MTSEELRLWNERGPLRANFKAATKEGGSETVNEAGEAARGVRMKTGSRPVTEMADCWHAVGNLRCPGVSGRPALIRAVLVKPKKHNYGLVAVVWLVMQGCHRETVHECGELRGTASASSNGRGWLTALRLLSQLTSSRWDEPASGSGLQEAMLQMSGNVYAVR